MAPKPSTPISAPPSKPKPKARRVPMRTRVAYHEAGHAVLSAAINDRPEVVTIRGDGDRLGFTTQKMFAMPTSIAQVFLAVFASEHILTGKCCPSFDREVSFALVARTDPGLAAAFEGYERSDGHRAVRAVLRIASFENDDYIRGEIERLYEIARESLVAIWPAVDGVAQALLMHETLDRDGLGEALGENDIYRPVYAVQKGWGLLDFQYASPNALIGLERLLPPNCFDELETESRLAPFLDPKRGEGLRLEGKKVILDLYEVRHGRGGRAEEEFSSELAARALAGFESGTAYVADSKEAAARGAKPRFLGLPGQRGTPVCDRRSPSRRRSDSPGARGIAELGCSDGTRPEPTLTTPRM